jgi:hypothetical protein
MGCPTIQTTIKVQMGLHLPLSHSAVMLFAESFGIDFIGAPIDLAVFCSFFHCDTLSTSTHL